LHLLSPERRAVPRLSLSAGGRLLAAAIALFAGAGCAKLTAVDVDLPADITSAVVFLHRGDQVSGRGPFDWNSELSIAYDGGRDRVGLAGYRRELPALEGDLHAASTCEPALPPPDVYLAVQGGKAAAAPPERLLHAPWLDASCEVELVLERLTPPVRCALARKGGCCFTGDGCSDPALAFTLDPGAGTLAGLPPGCEVETTTTAFGGKVPRFTVHCAPGSPLEKAVVWDRDAEATPSFSVDRIQLAGVGQAPRAEFDPDTQQPHTEIGLLADLAVFSASDGLRIAVAERSSFASCTDSKLAIVDAALLGPPLFTMPAPHCLEALAPNPFGPGFFGGFSRTGSTAALALFGPDGAERGEWSLPPLPPPARPGLVRALLAVGGALVALVVSPGFDSELVFLERDPEAGPVAFVVQSIGGPEPATALAPASGGGVLVLDQEHKQLLEFGPGGEPGAKVDLSFGVQGALLDFLSGQAGASVVSDLKGPSPALLTAGRRDLIRTPFYAQDATPLASAPWPDGALTLVGLASTSTAPEAMLALFDPAAARFLPGAYRLGFGVVNRIKVEPAVAGRTPSLWLLDSWTGELLRVRP
jgi:hypothetical protein